MPFATNGGWFMVVAMWLWTGPVLGAQDPGPGQFTNHKRTSMWVSIVSRFQVEWTDWTGENCICVALSHVALLVHQEPSRRHLVDEKSRQPSTLFRYSGTGNTCPVSGILSHPRQNYGCSMSFEAAVTRSWSTAREEPKHEPCSSCATTKFQWAQGLRSCVCIGS
ncbi:uncharacterized protein SEPMUDRAFT_120946 [Sphaerulina musiva SO2202]|uniref:Uncharacterized protein n=1 Tax=Sphaerulina musiva (strain SO2202) TaxID=692275 RepID=M3CZG2_SPHMS|nr:uncharacterized protein SEPMUDRAFT_120946 [Sphaerulina musiva SO2202]EMF09061.1 hypothetical protein SEPMUDRAFT_120946 [Sphaerulina musiva SO2202]